MLIMAVLVLSCHQTSFLDSGGGVIETWMPGWPMHHCDGSNS